MAGTQPRSSRIMYRLMDATYPLRSLVLSVKHKIRIRTKWDGQQWNQTAKCDFKENAIIGRRRSTRRCDPFETYTGAQRCAVCNVRARKPEVRYCSDDQHPVQLGFN